MLSSLAKRHITYIERESQNFILKELISMAIDYNEKQREVERQIHALQKEKRRLSSYAVLAHHKPQSYT